MPLKRLWNSLRGRSPQGPTTTAKAPPQNAVTGDLSASAPSSKPTTIATKTKPRGGLKLFGGPHSSLCKQIKPIQPKTVLEIGVGDGSRAIALLETIENSGEKPRYFAIDQFEMAGGEVTLKQFHQTLRSANVRPQVLPQPIAQGLMRMAHTHGVVDLVVIGTPQAEWQTPTIEAALARVMGANTAIFCLDGDSWIRYQLPGSTSLQRAA